MGPIIITAPLSRHSLIPWINSKMQALRLSSCIARELCLPISYDTALNICSADRVTLTQCNGTVSTLANQASRPAISSRNLRRLLLKSSLLLHRNNTFFPFLSFPFFLTHIRRFGAAQTRLTDSRREKERALGERELLPALRYRVTTYWKCRWFQ